MPMPDLALEGVRVLDLTQEIAGPYCTKLLADYGADVIKVEPSGGDPARDHGPFPRDDPHPEKSALFLHLNTNKRGVCLDLESAGGTRCLAALAAWADVVLESFPAGGLTSLGLGFETLSAANPRLVMTSITPFGQDGPYRDYRSSELVAYAMGGPMNMDGLPEREPVKQGGNVVQYQAGAAAAAATLIALWQARETGRGDHVDCSFMRTAVSSIDRRTSMLVTFQYTGMTGVRSPPSVLPALGMRPVQDGYIFLNGDGARFPLVLRMIGRPDLDKDPRFADFVARAQPGRAEEFDEFLMPWLLERTRQEAFQEMQRHHLPSGPVYTPAETLADPHFRERGFWADLEHPEAGRMTLPGRPFTMGASPWTVRRPAPVLGQHTLEVLCGLLGLTPAEVASMRAAGEAW
jgi:crotonobetainyl-CoA:carnitine CoA-transferase CaiB-like acyl-CoA transferase